MTPTPEQIAHVLELDSKRTQGEWWVPFPNLQQPYVVVKDWYDDANEGDGICEIFPVCPSPVADSQFIAAAPLMAQIIRHQQEQLRVTREALESFQRGDSKIQVIVADALSLIGESK